MNNNKNPESEIRNPRSLRSLTEKIKQRAGEIGFCKVGIVRAEALDAEGEHLKEWLASGYHGEMRWLERDIEKRADPRLLFPAARSVIVAALNYYTPHQHKESDETGKISRYAWGDDYHDVVGERLLKLLEWIKIEAPDADGRICVDTAPMMDKAWAVRAGLGWLGKHTNLITTEVGSWVFIGEILISLELDYETGIVEDHCGTCTACLDACPTGAFPAPYLVDSNRCISYATIELRDPEIPQAIAANMAGWLYGCDICQEVCPWNRFERPAAEVRFEPREDNTSPYLESIINLSDEEYVEKFRRSAIKRAKLSGLKRNAETLKAGRKAD